VDFRLLCAFCYLMVRGWSCVEFMAIGLAERF